MSKGIQVLIQFIGTAIFLALLVMGLPHLERHFNQVHLLLWGIILLAIGIYAIRKNKSWKWRVAPFLLSLLAFIAFVKVNFVEIHHVKKYTVSVGSVISVTNELEIVQKESPGTLDNVQIDFMRKSMLKEVGDFGDMKYKVIKPGEARIKISTEDKKYSYEVIVMAK
jgi:ABC-type transport system involved in multi-copper enzyme maturation permease subunit